VIGLISGTVTAAARSLGHYIALSITSLLMLFVGAMLLRSAISGQRCWMHGPDSPSPHRAKRYGPFLLQQLAVCLVIADPLRHVLFDVGLWAGCSNNPTYARINSTDAFPSGCYDSSYQYRCTVPCCVPTWKATSNATTEYAWSPPQSQLPQLATLRPDGTIYLPSGYAAAQQPWEVFKPGALLWESGLAHAGAGGGLSDADCEHGANSATGYCFLVDEATPMPYADRLKLLPLKDAAKPFDAETNPHECNCNQCSPSETMSHLAPLGILFTLVFTYTGFLLLAMAVAWNANIAQKLRGMRAKWQALRGRV